MAANEVKSRYYTSAEVAAMFGRSIDWVYDRVRDEDSVNPARSDGTVNSPMLWTEADIAQLDRALRPKPAVKKRRSRRRAGS